MGNFVHTIIMGVCNLAIPSGMEWPAGRTHTGLKGGGVAPSQFRGGRFRCPKFCGAPWILCITPHRSPEYLLLVCGKVAETPRFRVGNFAANLKRKISHVKLKCRKPPAPPV